MDLAARIEMLKDEIAALSDIIKRDGMIAEGSQGQPVAHPAVTQRHSAIALLHKLESRLDDGPATDPLAEFMNEND